MYDRGARKVTHRDRRVRLGTAADVLEEVQIALSTLPFLPDGELPALYVDPIDRRCGLFAMLTFGVFLEVQFFMI